ncbi:unnamed protein product [Cylindrotheca closterium]|uniref:EF-hand domain-containing protein n=1 Tax=Cylindrotheca closterium TaxID=2856 RepID=A0AAD2CTM7_9STRA|nr:unnamed protein product [Cylindrotheca closterium]
MILYKIRKFAEQQAARPISFRSSDKSSDVQAMVPKNSHSFSNLELHEDGSKYSSFWNSKIVCFTRSGRKWSIERDEFIAWYANHLEADKHVSPKERAEELFNSFDLNHSGEVTIGMFKQKMDNFKFGFTIDDLERSRTSWIEIDE